MLDSLSIKDFLTLFFQTDDLQDHNAAFNVFLTPGPTIKWFDTPAEAASFVSEYSKFNCYFSPGLFPARGVSGKGKAADVIGMSSFYLDIDVLSDAHQKTNLPPTDEDALGLLDACPFKPTVIVNTGHGFHAYWLFKEIWWFDDEKERKIAANLSKNLNTFFINAAKSRGWIIDSVYNLDRVLRLPGTNNVKDRDNPIRTSIHSLDYDLRYSYTDFQGFLDNVAAFEDVISERFGANVNYYDLVISRDASLPEEKFSMIMEADSEFASLWYKQATDGDTSLSGYDMRLACRAVKYGWTPQEVADLIICFRRKNAETEKDILKSLRVDYLTQTIKKAKEFVEKQVQDEELDRLSAIAEERQRKGQQITDVPEDVRQQEISAARSVLANHLKINIKKIIKYVSSPPVYAMVIETKDNEGNVGDKVVEIGSSDRLLGQGKLRNILFDATGEYIQPKKPVEWVKICKAFTFLVELNEETPVEFNDLTMLEEMIAEFIENEGVVTELSLDAIEAKSTLALDRKVFDPKLKKEVPKGKRIYVFLQSLRNYLFIVHKYDVSLKQLALYMVKINCKPKKMVLNFQVDGKKVTKTCRLWQIPFTPWMDMLLTRMGISSK